MLPRKRKREKMGVRQDSRISCPQHLAYVRSLECSVNDEWCEGRIEPHHVREGLAGVGRKPDDSDAVPLCAYHHKLGHVRGWQTFERIYLIDLSRIASALWERSPAGQRYRMKERV
ncbi:MAG: hypothetical protein KGL39_58780 [Patescibacteria group bacterium]|nr:hypothetical protein [Patescibacteria group bacterium]